MRLARSGPTVLPRQRTRSLGRPSIEVRASHSRHRSALRAPSCPEGVQVGRSLLPAARFGSAVVGFEAQEVGAWRHDARRPCPPPQLPPAAAASQAPPQTKHAAARPLLASPPMSENGGGMQALCKEVAGCPTGARLAAALESASLANSDIPSLITAVIGEKLAASGSAGGGSKPAAASGAVPAAATPAGVAAAAPGERQSLDSALCVVDGLSFLHPRWAGACLRG